LEEILFNGLNHLKLDEYSRIIGGMGFSNQAPHPFASGLRARQFAQAIGTIITGVCTPYDTIAKLA
jgi:hypothetical protein